MDVEMSLKMSQNLQQVYVNINGAARGPLTAKPAPAHVLAMLSVTDLCVGLPTLPTVLGVLWGRQAALDAVLILLSYTKMLHTAGAIASREGRIKSSQTCVSHISAVSVFYIPIVGLTMVHGFGKHLSPLVHVLMDNVSILFPPLMKPLIYRIKTLQTRVRIQRFFYVKGT
ncbi:olfactory receptor 51V1-like [Thomomys bottae]